MAVRSRAMVPSTASRVLIRLSAFTRETLSGRLYCPYAGKSLVFFDVMDFVNSLDSLLDEIAFPLASTQYRSFSPKRKKKAAGKEPGRERAVEEEVELERMDPRDSSTFIVHVQFRQNATWQGTVRWAGQNQEQRFRSTLELLKIMDSAMNDSAPPKGDKG